MPDWQRKTSIFVHWAFYLLVILQPVLGIAQAAFVDYPVSAFGLIEYSALAAPSESMAQVFHIAHSINGKLLLLLILVHVGAALGHHFYRKDIVLRRILPFGRVPGGHAESSMK